MGLLEKASANIDGVIEQSLNGKGALTDYFKARHKELRDKIKSDNEFEHSQDANKALLSEKELNEAVNKQLREDAKKLKPALEEAIKGNTGAAENMNVDTINNMATQASRTMAGFSQGGILGTLGGLTGLAGMFDWVKDLFNSVLRYFGRTDKSQTFSDVSSEVRMEKGVVAFSKNAGVDPRKLMAELTADPKPAPAPAAASGNPEAAGSTLTAEQAEEAKKAREKMVQANASGASPAEGTPSAQPVPDARTGATQTP